MSFEPLLLIVIPLCHFLQFTSLTIHLQISCHIEYNSNLGRHRNPFPKTLQIFKTIHSSSLLFTTSLMVKPCSLLHQVTKNQHRCCSPRVRCIPQGSGTDPYSSSPSSLPLPCFLLPPEITHTQQISSVIKSYLIWQSATVLTLLSHQKPPSAFSSKVICAVLSPSRGPCHFPSHTFATSRFCVVIINHTIKVFTLHPQTTIVTAS